MKTDKKLDLKSLQPVINNLKVLALKHALFEAIIIVLLSYVFVIWQINQYSDVQPAPDSQSSVSTQNTVPQIDKNTITKIQSLEKTNTQVQSLFDQARKNPFQE